MTTPHCADSPGKLHRGRFAPTPSGPLHLGSLLTALASYLHAKAAGGHWLLRIDDLDTPRCVPGAGDTIMRQLEAHALTWDESAVLQTQHLARYQEAIETLSARGLTYACACTRMLLKARSHPGPDGPVYDGHCRELRLPADGHALRLRVDCGCLCFDDGLQGRVCRSLGPEVGDFVLRRADGIVGYQLACAVDETLMGITDVVRGADLLGSSFRQLHLMALLNVPRPRYLHLPLLIDHSGRKLSKQNHAAPIDAANASRNLQHCLQLLGQQPPDALTGATPKEWIDWAVPHWQPASVPRASELQVEPRL